MMEKLSRILFYYDSCLKVLPSPTAAGSLQTSVMKLENLKKKSHQKSQEEPQASS